MLTCCKASALPQGGPLQFLLIFLESPGGSTSSNSLISVSILRGSCGLHGSFNGANVGRPQTQTAARRKKCSRPGTGRGPETYLRAEFQQGARSEAQARILEQIN